MWPSVLIVIYSALIVLASLAGGVLPTLFRMTHARMQVLVSGVAGFMLGVSVFHMIPHAAGDTRSLDQAMWWLMIGLLAMFFLIRMFHFHHHDSVEATEEPHHHDHDCGHDHDHDAGQAPAKQHRLSWIGVALGLGVHTLIDGVALGASVQADAIDQTGWAFLGGGTFLAILLHKPLDAMSITSLMTAGGWSPLSRHLVNAAFSLMCPLGAVLFDLGIQQFAESRGVLIGCALAFSAGVFLCISLGDLLPEVQFHSHDRLKLSAALLAGVALAYAIGYLHPNDHKGHGGHHNPLRASQPNQ